LPTLTELYFHLFVIDFKGQMEVTVKFLSTLANACFNARFMNSFPYFRNCKIYFWCMAIFLFSGFLLLSFKSTASSFILLNSFHAQWLDTFFICYTYVGDGLFAIGIFIVMLLLKRKEEAFSVLLSFITSGLLVQLLKRLHAAPRPKLFFEAGQYLHFIDGITLSGNNSFPSGHATTAFAVATVLAVLLRNKTWQWPILMAAMLVGYSRIYLAQHFLIDVLVGAIVGFVCGILSVYIVKKIKLSGYSVHSKRQRMPHKALATLLRA